jgi:alpha-glucosidase (family GH31 glycosyl hydrolase)
MIGDSLLVAPVVTEGATSRSVYFPKGTWYDVWTGDVFEGGQRRSVDAPIGSPPVFSRGEDRDDLRNAESMLTVEDCR